MRRAPWSRSRRRRPGLRSRLGERFGRRSPAPPEFAGDEGWTRTKRGTVKLTRGRERALRREAVEECEAFLLGRYAELLESRSTAVPAWAWTNVLAHGDPDDLHRAAEDCPASTTTSRGWRAARAYLASELLETAGRNGSLADVQRQVLAPLELQLAARRDVRSWTPRQWVTTVRSSVDAYRHSQRS